MSCPEVEKDGWRETITRELGFHRSYIRGKIDDPAKDYEEPVARILRFIATERKSI
jgi:hypothetical protein